MTSRADHDLLLMPTPRSIARLSGEVAADAAVREARAGGLAAGAYTITITPERGVEIAHGDDAGLRHARATLAQLRAHVGTECLPTRAGKERLPALRIDDAPCFATRGVMVDVSRCRVPTMPQLFDLVDTISALKGNHLQLYTEHTFAYAGHEAAWRGWSPMTPDEVRALDAYAAARGVALVANQNCFGHLGHWLRLPEYAHLAETHGDWVFDVWPRSGPFSLCPTDARSIAFVRDLLGQLLPCFTSPLVNIGCDETYDIAYGRSAAAVRARGRAAVYMDFVRQVCDVARGLGKRPMFWADIALHDPACVPTMPSDLLALAWGYEPDAPFDEWLRVLRDAGAGGREAWVCPGTSSWRSITGRTRERTQNIEAAAHAGVRRGATGLLICDWGDTGHHQQWPIALQGIAHGLAKAWNADAPFDARAAAVHALTCPPELGPWLERLGDADAHLRAVCGQLARVDLAAPAPLRNQSALFIDMHNHALDAMTHVCTHAQWVEALERVNSARAGLPARLPSLVRDELAHTLDYATFAAQRGAVRRQPGGAGARDRARMAGELRALKAAHERLWPARSRRGGLAQSLAFFDTVRV